MSMPAELWEAWQTNSFEFDSQFRKIKPRPSSEETRSWIKEHPELADDSYFMGIVYHSEIIEFIRRNHVKTQLDLIEWACIHKPEWVKTIYNGYCGYRTPRWLFYELSNMRRCTKKLPIPMEEWK